MFLRGARSAYSAKPEACSFDNRQHFSRAEESFAVGPGPVPRLTEDVSLPVVFPTFSGENGTYRSERSLVHVPQIDRRRNEVVRTICCTQSAISSISSSTHGLSLHTTTKGPSRYAPWSVYAAAIASRKTADLPAVDVWSAIRRHGHAGVLPESVIKVAIVHIRLSSIRSVDAAASTVRTQPSHRWMGTCSYEASASEKVHGALPKLFVQILGDLRSLRPQKIQIDPHVVLLSR